MTANEYITWLKGFTEACNDYHPTPAQWDTIKEELKKVGHSFTINGTTSNSTSVSSTNPYPTGTNITYTTKHQLND